VERCDMAFQRCPDTERNNRCPVLTADIHDIDHFIGGLREHNRVGRLGCVMGFIGAVTVADRLVCGQPVAKTLSENIDRRLYLT